MTDVHFTWLMGPADNPDPRVGDMSASAAHRGPWTPTPWDMWLGQPAQAIRPDEGDAA